MARTLQPGEVIDRYTVLSLLGEGGMAAVYAVRHNTLGSSHALKLLKIENEGIQRRLVAEGQVQASLRHPNIVAVTDVLVVDGQIGLLMEHIQGLALDAWLRENRPSLKDALALFRGILAGVSRAHRAGLVHRDLKPGNVLLDSADGLTIPKVADFGLAKILAESEGGHSRTRSGLPMGTPQFMAPEQIRSAKEVDTRADIFALGCILYVLVCGQVPFEDPDMLELFNKIANGRYIPPTALVPGLDPRVDQTIRACLAIDRDRRPQDCEAVRTMLYGDDDAMTGGVKLSPSPPPSTLLRAEPLVAARTSLPLSSVQSSQLAEGAIAAPPPRSSKQPLADTPSTPASGATDRSGLTIGVVAVVGILLFGLLTVAVGGVTWFWYQSRMEAAELAAIEAARSPDDVLPVQPEARQKDPVENDPAEKEPAEKEPAEIAPPASKETAAADGGSKRSATAPDTKASSSMEDSPPPSKTPVKAAETGQLSVSGRVESVKLSSGGRSFKPGILPVGSYTVTYTFAGRSPQQLGTVLIEAGDRKLIACDHNFAICQLQ